MAEDLTCIQRRPIEDREYNKFTCNSDGLTAVRGVVEGNFSFSGLRNAGRISVVALNDTTWTALPLVPLTARNAICIQNESGIIIKTNYDNAEPGFVGMSIGGSGGERQYDITDTIIIYAKAQSGTPSITLEELS